MRRRQFFLQRRSLLQASPVDQDMAGAGTGGFAGAYKGNQAQVPGRSANHHSKHPRQHSALGAASLGSSPQRGPWQAGGILGMLATIQSDFERTISMTSEAEETAHRDYVKSTRISALAKSSDTYGLLRFAANMYRTRITVDLLGKIA